MGNDTLLANGDNILYASQEKDIEKRDGSYVSCWVLLLE
jgi:hypothetical protein